MNKLSEIGDGKVTLGYYFYCAGCEYGHAVHVAPDKNDLGASWTFNGDLDAPTFHPSILSKVVAAQKVMTCHIFVRGGKIEYLSDCTHGLRGKTIEMQDV